MCNKMQKENLYEMPLELLSLKNLAIGSKRFNLKMSKFLQQLLFILMWKKLTEELILITLITGTLGCVF